MAVPVYSSDLTEAEWALRPCESRCSCCVTSSLTLLPLQLIWADSAYLGPLQMGVWETWGWHLQVVGRLGSGRGSWLRADQEPPPRLSGFHSAPHRWIVERTFAWTLKDRAQPPDEPRR